MSVSLRNYLQLNSNTSNIVFEPEGHGETGSVAEGLFFSIHFPDTRSFLHTTAASSGRQMEIVCDDVVK